jgi:spore coat protein CotH
VNDHADWLFGADEIHNIDITLSEESIDAIWADPYSYTSADVTIDGQTASNVGVRLRGKIGSFRDLNGKPKFKIDFNQFQNQDFYGLDTLSLNNEVVDCSYLREPIAYRVFKEMGIPTPRVGFSTVSVNGAPYGLYVTLEAQDDKWLDLNYEDSSGNLYDGKYLYFLAGWGYDYQLLDFKYSLYDLYQLEEGTSVKNADLENVTNVIQSNVGANYYEALQSVVDTTNFHPHIAAEQWTGHLDGYALNTNNYRLYFNPTDGLMSFLPWDFDLAFLYDWQWGFDWNNPAGDMVDYCYRNSACLQAQKDAVGDLIAHLETVDLIGYFETLNTLTYDAALADPRRECASASIGHDRDHLRNWILTRSDQIASEWGL